MAAQIDKGIPIPISKTASGGMPFKELEVGDSFFVPRPGQEIQGSKTFAARQTGFKFTARSVVEGGVKGTRVWRIK